MKCGINLVAAAFALTALSYGLARFAYGLLLPQIREDLSLGATAAGWIGGSAFAAYCLGIVFAFLTGVRLGERNMAVLAGLAATLGMGLVVVATSAVVLGMGVALAGLSTGLTSPPLVSAVARQFDEEARPKANGTINAGTAAGIVFSGLAAMAFPGAWQELYVLFALIGAAVTAWLWFAVPAGVSSRNASAPSLRTILRPSFAGLCASAFLMGASSTANWTFGADIMRDELGFSEGRIALAWIVVGVSGIAGSATGILTYRFGIGPVHRTALFAMALGCLGLAAATMAPAVAYVAMGLFGAAYIVSTGAFLIWGIMLLPDRPDLGLGIPFLAIAVGQTVGAPLFGAILDAAGTGTALLSFAAIACSATVWGVRVTAALEHA